jgi:hypothetical protein
LASSRVNLERLHIARLGEKLHHGVGDDLADAADIVEILIGRSRSVVSWFAVEFEDVVDILAKFRPPIDDETGLVHPFERAVLGIGRTIAHFTPGIGKEFQRPRGGDREPTGRRVAPPDDKLREAIHLSACDNVDYFVASLLAIRTAAVLTSSR